MQLQGKANIGVQHALLWDVSVDICSNRALSIAIWSRILKLGGGKKERQVGLSNPSATQPAGEAVCGGKTAASTAPAKQHEYNDNGNLSKENKSAINFLKKVSLPSSHVIHYSNQIQAYVSMYCL